jgi:hypothetical protein
MAVIEYHLESTGHEFYFQVDRRVTEKNNLMIASFKF